MGETGEGYKQTKVGMIPEEWDIPRIDSVLQRIRKKVDVEKETLYQQIGIRSHAKGIFHKEPVTGEVLGNKSVFWIEEDSFIVNIVFAWEQAVAKTTTNEKGMIASHRFPMYKSKDNKADIDYILYFFKSKRGKHLLGLASPGGAGRNKTLGQKEFAELKIPLPPIEEQQKIAQILSTWDDAISKQEQLIVAKETLKKGLMQRLLSGEVRFGSEALASPKDTQWGGTEVPLPEWEEVRLGDIGITYGGLTGKKAEDFGMGNAKYVTYKNIFDNSKLDVELFENVKISPTEQQNKVQFGDILFTTSSETPEEVGMSSVLLDNIDELYLNSFCFGYRVNNIEILNPNFARFYFRSFDLRDKISRLAQGSTRFNLSKKQVMKIKVKLPPSKEQQKIAQVLTTADKEIELLKTELEALKEQKRGLMQRLLSGVVRVKIDE